MRTHLIPWEASPTRSLLSLRSDMDSLFDRFFANPEGASADGHSPRLNVAESPTEYEVSLELPGVSPQEIEVEVHNNQLLVRGEKKRESEVKDKAYHRVERSYGKFQRVVGLGAAVEEDKVTAKFADGVLTVVIPKAEKAKPKKITVASS